MLTRTLKSLLFSVSTTDPVSFVLTASLLTGGRSAGKLRAPPGGPPELIQWSRCGTNNGDEDPPFRPTQAHNTTVNKNSARLRNAIDALYAYCEDPHNPLNGPELSKLLAEANAAYDALVAVVPKTSAEGQHGNNSGTH